jgi:hypothetical protein
MEPGMATAMETKIEEHSQAMRPSADSMAIRDRRTISRFEAGGPDALASHNGGTHSE